MGKCINYLCFELVNATCTCVSTQLVRVVGVEICMCAILSVCVCS